MNATLITAAGTFIADTDIILAQVLAEADLTPAHDLACVIAGADNDADRVRLGKLFKRWGGDGHIIREQIAGTSYQLGDTVRGNEHSGENQDLIGHVAGYVFESDFGTQYPYDLLVHVEFADGSTDNLWSEQLDFIEVAEPKNQKAVAADPALMRALNSLLNMDSPYHTVAESMSMTSAAGNLIKFCQQRI